MSVFDAYVSLAAGVFIGAVVGFVAQRANFCSTGAIADIILANDWRRARSWIMAAVVALAGTHAAAAFGFISLAHNAYTTPIGNPILALPGGITFGYGMAIAGGCLQRALVRIGGGSVRSLITVAVMVLFGFLTLYITVKTGLWKKTWPNIEAPSSVTQVADAVFGTRGELAALIVGGVVAAALFAFCLKDKWFRSSPEHLRGGVVIGLVVAFAWLIVPSTNVYARGLNPFVDLINSVREVGHHESMEIAASSLAFRFVVVAAVPVGMILGSFVAAASRQDLLLDWFADRDDVKRHLVGGALMGVGGTLMFGCTFGPGLSGFAVLSFISLLAIAAMIAGCVWGIRALEAGSAWGGLRLCFGRKAS